MFGMLEAGLIKKLLLHIGAANYDDDDDDDDGDDDDVDDDDDDDDGDKLCIFSSIFI